MRQGIKNILYRRQWNTKLPWCQYLR